MKMSQLFTKTRREAPSDEVSKNAQLLIRAGYVHKEMAGVYAYMPLGLKVIEKIKNIIREEMVAVGGQEVAMTVLQPRELWEKTDRWDDSKVDNWFKTKLITGVDVGVGLTHEEPMVDMLLDYISSYKDLPVIIFQIQSKFRNEKRAKSGLLRGREFLMKDMYSFARDQVEHDRIYEEVALSYQRVYERLGIGDRTFRVKADGGIFTERYSDEFQTLTTIGEDILFHVPSTDIYYNQEVAPSQSVDSIQNDTEMRPMQEVYGENIVGVEDLAAFLNVPPESTTKTMIYVTDTNEIVAVAIRGDYQINEIKLRKVLGVKKVQLADEETVNRVTGSIVGYAGLVGLSSDVRVIVDDSCKNRVNFEMGANKAHYHNINVNWGRDVPMPQEFYDIKLAKDGDIHPETNIAYELCKAVEVGNIFPLETKYTNALGLHYKDEEGNQSDVVMGCYGIGVSRVFGVLAEIYSDDRGIVWPKSVAPFAVHLVSASKNPEGQKVAQDLYQNLLAHNIEVLFDDRDGSIGEKLADADLMGMPIRVVVGDKSLEAGGVGFKLRNSDNPEIVVPVDSVIETIRATIAS
jgi:prolyl-tRNA synthetase